MLCYPLLNEDVMTKRFLLHLAVLSLVVYSSSEECVNTTQAECCRRSLRLGQYFCTSPVIDDFTQAEKNCDPLTRKVNVSCYAALNVMCQCGEVVVQYDKDQCVFMEERPCRYVKGRRYDYRVAVALSLFLGLFGIDRFYLGYPAIGMMKLFTLGFFLIGHFVDFLLILVQAVGPADRSDYYAPFYGPLLQDVVISEPVNVSSDICSNLS